MLPLWPFPVTEAPRRLGWARGMGDKALLHFRVRFCRLSILLRGRRTALKDMFILDLTILCFLTLTLVYEPGETSDFL